VAYELFGDFDQSLRKRHRLIAAKQPYRSGLVQWSVARKASEHVTRIKTRPRQQARGEPRTGELAGEVIVKVAHQPPVSRIKLGSQAQDEQRSVKFVEVEFRHRVREGDVDRHLWWHARQRPREVIGYVQTAERIGGMWIGGRHLLHGGVNQAGDVVEAPAVSGIGRTPCARRWRRRGRSPKGARGPPHQPRPRARRRAQ